MWLNYHHLFYFKTVVDHGSIAEASKALRIGQPAISIQIKMLEEVLDRKLFDRTNRKLVLTETGTLTYNYANQIFNLGDELLTTISDRGEDHTKIQIGIEGSVPKNIITKMSSHIFKQFNSQVSIFDGTSEQIVHAITNHKYDLGVLNHRPAVNNKAILFSKRMIKSRVILAGTKDFIRLKGRSLRNFTEVPMILPLAQSPLRQSIEFAFGRLDLKINMIAESEDTGIQKNMAIEGLGVIAIMEEAIEGLLRSHRLIKLYAFEDVFDEVWFVTAKRNTANPIANSLLHDFEF